jgi:hypothetical protein
MTTTMTLATNLDLGRKTALLLSILLSSILLWTVDRLSRPSRLLPALLTCPPLPAAPPCHPLLQAGLLLLGFSTNTVSVLPRLLPAVGRGLATLTYTWE